MAQEGCRRAECTADHGMGPPTALLAIPPSSSTLPAFHCMQLPPTHPHTPGSHLMLESMNGSSVHTQERTQWFQRGPVVAVGVWGVGGGRRAGRQVGRWRAGGCFAAPIPHNLPARITAPIQPDATASSSCRHYPLPHLGYLVVVHAIEGTQSLRHHWLGRCCHRRCHRR